VGVGVGVGEGVAVGDGVGLAAGVELDPQAARPIATIAVPMTAVTFISCLYPFNANTSSGVTPLTLERHS
jgi:hypothetical protein